jgi:hypothetical protein
VNRLRGRSPWQKLPGRRWSGLALPAHPAHESESDPRLRADLGPTPASLRSRTCRTLIRANHRDRRTDFTEPCQQRDGFVVMSHQTARTRTTESTFDHGPRRPGPSTILDAPPDPPRVRRRAGDSSGHCRAARADGAESSACWRSRDAGPSPSRRRRRVSRLARHPLDASARRIHSDVSVDVLAPSSRSSSSRERCERRHAAVTAVRSERGLRPGGGVEKAYAAPRLETAVRRGSSGQILTFADGIVASLP